MTILPKAIYIFNAILIKLSIPKAFSHASQVVLVVKDLLANAEDTRDVGSIPESERYPGGGNDTPLQYSCLKNSMDRGAWWTTVHGVVKSQTQLTQPTTTNRKHLINGLMSSIIQKRPGEQNELQAAPVVSQTYLAIIVIEVSWGTKLAPLQSITFL